jgi:hypothetical protein
MPRKSAGLSALDSSGHWPGVVEEGFSPSLIKGADREIVLASARCDAMRKILPAAPVAGMMAHHAAHSRSAQKQN